MQILDDYIKQVRPPVNIRKELDISYRITNQSVEIFEIRPQWDNPNNIINTPVAKNYIYKNSRYMENILDES